MTTAQHITRLSPQQHAALVVAAKARAHQLRREALDAALDAVGAALRQALSALWPQNRTKPADTGPVTRQPAPAVQNRPRGPLRLLDNRCSPSSLN